MASEVSKSTAYFDGSRPLCEAEVCHYRRPDRAGALCFVDISNTATVMPPEMTRQRAIARFHVRRSDGRVLSGAAAFVEVSKRLPGWRLAARAASLPGALPVLELGYRMFLPVRPFLAALFRRVLRLRSGVAAAKRV